MNADDKELWIVRHRCKAADCIRTIAALRKQKVSDFDARIRLLEDFEETLFVKSSDPQQLELFDPADLLSPQLKRVLATPTAGLE